MTFLKKLFIGALCTFSMVPLQAMEESHARVAVDENTKVLVFDLGGICTSYSTFKYFYNHLLVFDFGWHLLTLNDPRTLEKSIFDTLKKWDTQPAVDFKLTCNTKGENLPYLVCAYQAGLVDSKTALEVALGLHGQSTYSSETEANLVKYALEAMFTPDKQLSTFIFLEEGKSVLKELFRERDTKKMLIVALTNWDRESFELFKQAHSKFFEKFDHLFVSGEMKTIKPNADAFNQVMKKLNAKPENVYFFDDQEENIRAAQLCGISNVHLYKNADALKKYLREQNLCS